MILSTAAALQVPNNLANLVNLRTLLLGFKLIKVLPQPVLALTALEHLSVAFCKLSRVPPELTAMRHLRELHLKGNSGLIVSRFTKLMVAYQFNVWWAQQRE